MLQMIFDSQKNKHRRMIRRATLLVEGKRKRATPGIAILVRFSLW